MNQDILKISQLARPIFKQFGVQKAALFGSVARGEAKASSAIDLLVDIKRPVGFIKLNSLQISLEKTLGKKVDLVEFDGVNNLLKPFIFKDAFTIYEG